VSRDLLWSPVLLQTGMCLFYGPWIVVINMKSFPRTKLFPAKFTTCLWQSSQDYLELS